MNFSLFSIVTGCWCCRGSAAAVCGETSRVVLQGRSQPHHPLPRCYSQVLIPRGENATHFSGLRLFTERVSQTLENAICDAEYSLLPLPKNITLSKWNFLLIWASLHSNSSVHLWCTGIGRYNLWTRQNEPCPIPLSQGEVPFWCIHGTYFYATYMWSVYTVILFRVTLLIFGK